MRRIAPLLAIALLTACGDARAVQDGSSHASTLTVNLAYIGTVLLWVGSIAGSVGLALELLGHFGIVETIATGVSGIVLKVLHPFAPYLASGGLCAFGVGCTCLYLSDHPWIILLALVASALVIGYIHLDDIRRWLVGRAQPSTPAPKP